MKYYTYITTNATKNVLYTGMTNNLARRMREHRKQKGEKKSFSGRYNCYRLVYFEVFNKPMEAIRREKEIKNFSRERKIALIKTKNRNFHTYNIW